VPAALGSPALRTWNLVQLPGKLLLPAAQALRYCVLEEAEKMLRAHDAPLLWRSGG
jgi:hypothetical protein